MALQFNDGNQCVSTVEHQAPYIWTFKEQQPAVRIVGGKFLGLWKLDQIGVRVPNAICITTRLFDEVYTRRINPNMVVRPGWDLSVWLDPIARPILTKFLQQPSADSVRDTLFVRSSATVEDQRLASFAGQFVSLTEPRDYASVSDGIRQCWASFYAEHVSHYAKARGIDLELEAMAVVLQDAIAADASGVLFTRDPVLGEEFVRIESTFGLASPIVGSLITPDSFVVPLKAGHVEARAGSKRLRHDIGENGHIVTSAMPPADAERLSLEEKEVIELVEIGVEVAREFKAPQDIEFVIRQGRIFLVQARPITAL